MKPFIEALKIEMQRARAKHGPADWSRHEFYGVLLEEVDELWDTIKQNENAHRLLEELIQVAAVCAEYYEFAQQEHISTVTKLNECKKCHGTGWFVDPTINHEHYIKTLCNHLDS